MKNKKRVDAKANYVSTREVSEKFKVPKAILVDRKKKRKLKPTVSKLESYMSDRVTAVEDNKRMMELLPDLVLVKRIMVPSILSPKDLSTYVFALKMTDDEEVKDVPPTVIQQLVTHFKTTYNLESKLSKILEDALFDVGSYCLLTLPESSLSAIAIRAKAVSMESYHSLYNNASLGHFNDKGILSKDSSVRSIRGLTVTDNINHLLGSQIRKKAISQQVSKVYGVSAAMESIVVGGGERAEHTHLSLKSSHGEDGSRVNNPLVMRIPSDCVIPVHTPSDPTDHVGYFILLDSNGVPVTKVQDVDGLGKLKSQIAAAANDNSLGGLIVSTGFNMGRQEAKANPDMVIEQYVELVEEELNAQLQGGVYGSEVEVARPIEVYHIMLARALSKLKTKILYVPAEIMSYFAFNYNSRGIGVSLLEITKVFGSLRAILLFAQVMAGVKNSVGRTKLDITLDVDDPDPSATIDAVIHHFAGLQTESLPLGLMSAGDIVKSLQKASVDVNVDGGDAFPGTKTEISDAGRDFKEPDSDLSDMLRRMQYNGIGMPAEIIDGYKDGDLATLVVSRNQLYAKQIMEFSKKFETMVTTFIRNYIRCSGELINLLKDSDLGVGVDVFIDNLLFTLPVPDLSRIKSQSDALEIYSTLVDRAVSFYINEDTFIDLLEGDVDSAKLSALQLSYSNLLKREWMQQQNILPEMAITEDVDLSGKIKEHNQDILRTLRDIIIPLLKDEKRLAERIDMVVNPPEPEVDDTGDVTEGDTETDTVDDGVVDDEAVPAETIEEDATDAAKEEEIKDGE